MLYFHVGHLVPQLAIQTNRNFIFNLEQPVSKVVDLNHATETCYSSNVSFVSDDEQFEAHKENYFQKKFGNEKGN